MKSVSCQDLDKEFLSLSAAQKLSGRVFSLLQAVIYGLGGFSACGYAGRDLPGAQPGAGGLTMPHVHAAGGEGRQRSPPVSSLRPRLTEMSPCSGNEGQALVIMVFSKVVISRELHRRL